MEITQETTDALNGVLTVTVNPEDYKDKVDGILEDYRKQVKMPGFRPGKVPIQLVRKQYGKAVLADELNKLLGAKMDGYIREQKLRLLGQPIPAEEGDSEGNWEKPDVFTFRYDIGLSPKVDIKFGWFTKFVHHKVRIDDDLINDQIEDLRRRYGKMSDRTEVEENCLMVGEFVELESDGKEVKPGGVMNEGTISLESVKDKKTHKALIGLSQGAEVVVKPGSVSRDADDLARMLGIEAKAAEDFKSPLRFTIKEVRHIEPAELGEELYDKLFGEDVVNDEEGFRAKVKEDLQRIFERDGDRVFRRKFVEEVVDKLDPPLPEDFLKRWIRVANEKPITAEEIEAEFSEYAKGIKWQIIQNHIIDEHGIEVEGEEIKEEAGNAIKAQYSQYGIPLNAEQLDPMVTQMLTDQKEVRRVAETIYERKAIDKLRELAKIKEKEVSHEGWMEIVRSL
jgi:trigger factor